VIEAGDRYVARRDRMLRFGGVLKLRLRNNLKVSHSLVFTLQLFHDRSWCKLVKGAWAAIVDGILKRFSTIPVENRTYRCDDTRNVF
jgi:hypothetical protein